jgi:hypothetical protein
MSNIDAVPGGFNAMVKMYKDLHQEADTPMAAPSGTIAVPGSYEAGIQGKPIPNVWAPNVAEAGVAGSFEPSAAAAMLQDPNMQALVANLFRSTAATGSQAPPGAGQPVAGSTAFAESATIGKLFDPSFMALVAELERSLGSPATAGAATAGPATNAGASFGSSFQTFMTAMADNPEIKWRAQLAALRSMGFSDTGACVRALQQSNGNVNRAIDILIAEAASNTNA